MIRMLEKINSSSSGDICFCCCYALWPLFFRRIMSRLNRGPWGPALHWGPCMAWNPPGPRPVCCCCCVHGNDLQHLHTPVTATAASDTDWFHRVSPRLVPLVLLLIIDSNSSTGSTGPRWLCWFHQFSLVLLIVNGFGGIRLSYEFNWLHQ